jgi:hypothetical protein
MPRVVGGVGDSSHHHRHWPPQYEPVRNHMKGLTLDQNLELLTPAALCASGQAVAPLTPLTPPLHVVIDLLYPPDHPNPESSALVTASRR